MKKVLALVLVLALALAIAVVVKNYHNEDYYLVQWAEVTGFKLKETAGRWIVYGDKYNFMKGEAYVKLNNAVNLSSIEFYVFDDGDLDYGLDYYCRWEKAREFMIVMRDDSDMFGEHIYCATLDELKSKLTTIFDTVGIQKIRYIDVYYDFEVETV